MEWSACKLAFNLSLPSMYSRKVVTEKKMTSGKSYLAKKARLKSFPKPSGWYGRWLSPVSVVLSG